MKTQEQIDKFLAALTDLSLEHDIEIVGACLFTQKSDRPGGYTASKYLNLLGEEEELLAISLDWLELVS